MTYMQSEVCRRVGAAASIGIVAVGLAASPGAISPGAAAPAASATASIACPAPLVASSTVTPPGGTPFTICSGKIPSFDGTPIDVDLSIPSNQSGPLPLMVMLHAFGGNKASWESTTLEGVFPQQYHWNNAWFVSNGYAVLTYTARGFYKSCGIDPASGYNGASDPACQGKKSWMHLADRRWEIRDFQYLSGKMVDAGIAQAQKIAVTGDSMGGGQSWLIAISQDQVVASNSTNPNAPILSAWTSPNGTPMRAMASIPLFTWSDLAAGLVPNGRQSDGFFGAPSPGSSISPPGFAKKSYDELFGGGGGVTRYAAPGADPTADVPSWFNGLLAGEPYSATVTNGLNEMAGAFRSAIAAPIPAPAKQIPVFAIAGTTDPLINSHQTLMMMNRLKGAYPSYPIWSFYGDLGHSYANNRPAVWQQANGAANAWLAAIKAGGTPTNPRVTVTTTPCTAGQTVVSYTSTAFQLIPTSTLSFSSATTQSTTNSTGTPPEGQASDPIANSGCRVIPIQTDPNVANWTFTPATASTVVGSPIVTTTVSSSTAHAQIAARLWDVDPVAGTQALLTRGVYHLVLASPGTTTVRFELFPAAWQVRAGHRLKLELTQNDMPFLRYDNLAGNLNYAGVSLVLPVR